MMPPTVSAAPNGTYALDGSNHISVDNGDSIASEGKGEYLYVEGRVLSTDGTPIPGALIETWETDSWGQLIFCVRTQDTPHLNQTYPSMFRFL